jgi:hypothetical protein
MTPSNGTSLSPTKTVWSLEKEEVVEEEEEGFGGEVESMFLSALASVRCKVLMELLLVNFGV